MVSFEKTWKITIIFQFATVEKSLVNFYQGNRVIYQSWKSSSTVNILRRLQI